MQWSDVIGPCFVTGGLTTLLTLFAEGRSRKTAAEKADAEADKIRTETYQLIVGDLRSELDRVRAEFDGATRQIDSLAKDLESSRAALDEISAWARVMAEWAAVHVRRLAEAGCQVDPIPELGAS